MLKRLLFILAIFSLSCCQNKKETAIAITPTSDIVKISGKISNFDNENKVINAYINRIGQLTLPVYGEVDSLGNFEISFKAEGEGDLWLSYNTNFLMAYKPGDSIFVQFDGKTEDRAKIHQNIKFPNSILNSEISEFLAKYYVSKLSNIDTNYTKLSIKGFQEYFNQLKNDSENLKNDYISTKKIQNQSTAWINTFCTNIPLAILNSYIDNHDFEEEQQKADLVDLYISEIELTKDDFICRHVLSSWSNNLYSASWEEVIAIKSNIAKEKKIEITEISKEVSDSLIFKAIYAITKNDLLKQMILTEHFQVALRSGDLNYYKNHQSIISEKIKFPLLANSLEKNFKSYTTETLNLNDFDLTSAKKGSVKHLLDSIQQENKGKILYMDVWANWCAPCVAEIPNSIKLKENFKNSDVAFVYLAIDSSPQNIKNIISKYQWEGQHYVLTKKQSSELRDVLGFSGIPFYILINKEGKVIEKSHQLNPENVAIKIKEQLLLSSKSNS